MPRTERETQDFIDNYVKRQPKSRNAQLASLDLVQHRVDSRYLTPEDLLSACKVYFDCNSNRLYCFHDLQRYLVKLDPILLETFLAYVSNEVVLENSENTNGKVRTTKSRDHIMLLHS